MRNAFVHSLEKMAACNEDIIVLVADNGAIVFDRFREQYPERFFNVGIAEANMVGVAAGLAACGKIPFAYTIGSFLTMRAFEQIRNDVCMQRMNVKLAGIGAGFVYSALGPTHHATEDIALMSSLPKMTILAPADPLEAAAAAMVAAKTDGPVYLRLATGGTPSLHQDKEILFEVGDSIQMATGTDLTIISHGLMVHEAMEASQLLRREGISARILNMVSIKPFDEKAVIQAAEETGTVLVVEDHSLQGGLGSMIGTFLLETGIPCAFARLGLEESFAVGYGSFEDLKEINRLDTRRIAAAARSLLDARCHH